MEYIPGYGNGAAKLMIVGDAPNNFAGHFGKELDKVLRDAGINRHECWITTVTKHDVPLNRRGDKPIPFRVRAKNVGINLDQMVSELQVEINSIKPNCILALSGTALWALTGKDKIGEHRGSIMMGMGIKTVPTYHPAHLSHQYVGGEVQGYWNRQIMIFDSKRALAQSQFRELVRPNRVLEIAKNSAHLHEFYERYKHRLKVSVDIEANGTCIPVCIGLAFHKGHGMTVPLWNVDGISIPDSDMVQMWMLLSHILMNHDVIGQNFNYDRDKIKRLGFTIRRIASDVMLKAHAINPELPKGLAFNTSIYTEEPFYKDEGMYHGSLHDLLIGCARDACVTFEVNENMDADLDEVGQRQFFENFLMKLPDFYWAMENQGFRIDPTQRDFLLHKYIEWDEKLRYELFQLVGDEVNVNSPKQIQILLWENFKLPRKKGTGEEEITELLNSPTLKNPTHRRVLEIILEDRRVRKSISTYLMALPDYDGRMRTTYFPCLETGRSSTGQQNPPIRPEVEVVDENGKKKSKVIGTAFQTMTKHGDIGADIRSMYIPDEGEIFVQADSSQAEARVVWLLADDEEALELVDKIDYHAWTASWFFGGTEADYSKKVLGYEHPIRFAGKTLRHAGHLGAGKRRASIELNTQARKYKIPISISEAIAEQALKIFHTKQPKIQKNFQAGVVACLENNRRSLVAPAIYGFDLKHGGRRTFYERWGEELFRQAFSYIPQRAVSDNTKGAGIRIRQRIPNIKIIMEAHDALLFSIPEVKKMEWIAIIKEEMERPIDFRACSIPRRPLVIPCDIEVGYNYEKLSKFKEIIGSSIPVPTSERKERSFYAS